MQTPVEWLEQQIGSKIADANIRISAPKFYELINQAKEMEAEQNEKYNELKEVIENIIEHLDEGRALTLRKDSIIVEALRNSINQ
jgi:hypothetical protein